MSITYKINNINNILGGALCPIINFFQIVPVILPISHVQQYDIGIIPYSVSLGDETYYKEISRTKNRRFFIKNSR